MQPKTSRPTGVTILGVLAILGGIAGLIGGFVLIGLGLLIGALTAAAIQDQLALSGYGGLAGFDVGIISAIIMVMGVVVLLLGILYLAVGIGFFGGKGWAWTLGIIVSVINIVLAVVQIAFGSYSSVVSLVIGGLIIYYLMRPHVKSFFGKGVPMTPTMGSGTTTP